MQWVVIERQKGSSSVVLGPVGGCAVILCRHCRVNESASASASARAEPGVTHGHRRWDESRRAESWENGHPGTDRKLGLNGRQGEQICLRICPLPLQSTRRASSTRRAQSGYCVATKCVLLGMLTLPSRLGLVVESEKSQTRIFTASAPQWPGEKKRSCRQGSRDPKAQRRRFSTRSFPSAACRWT
jgi:hypothetical protein